MKFSIKLHDFNSKGRIDTYQLKRTPYTADFSQACHILQAIRMNNQKPLSHSCLMHLSTFVAKSWEEQPSQEKVQEIYQYMTYLLDSSKMAQEEDKGLSLDDKIRKFCQNPSSIPTVCPSTTLLFAVHYIDKLKQKYKNVTGTNGCSKRLILVAFMIASKYIHSNLKIIVDISLKKAEQRQHLSLPQLPLSPPTSPKPKSPSLSKQHEITDPLQYHYFKPSSSPSFSPSTSAFSLVSPTKSQFDFKDTLPSITTTATNAPALDNNNKTNHGLPSLSSQLNYRVWRMEIEFLHFLNNNIKILNCIGLIEWAHQI
ncbi:hypothetical protein BJ944DRAFT_272303 [Cunninghamella echinulata]|nr:hypothetical protein BJ944DRAFT_272303 [Cunninghamella echinulata]